MVEHCSDFLCDDNFHFKTDGRRTQTPTKLCTAKVCNIINM